MKVQFLLLSVVAALVSTTFATHNAPHRQRRNAAAPETVEAQRIRRAQYVHPAGAAKRAALYESDKPLELEKRTFGNWWWHWGGSDDGHHNRKSCSRARPSWSLVAPLLAHRMVHLGVSSTARQLSR